MEPSCFPGAEQLLCGPSRGRSRRRDLNQRCFQASAASWAGGPQYASLRSFARDEGGRARAGTTSSPRGRLDPVPAGCGSATIASASPRLADVERRAVVRPYQPSTFPCVGVIRHSRGTLRGRPATALDRLVNASDLWRTASVVARSLEHWRCPSPMMDGPTAVAPGRQRAGRAHRKGEQVEVHPPLR